MARPVSPEYLVQAAKRRLPWIAAGTLLSALATGALWLVIPDRYESTARVLVREQQTVNPFLGEMMVDLAVKTREPLVRSVLTSHANLARVLRKRGEITADDSASVVEAKVRAFESQVEVVGLGGGLVRVKVRGRTPTAAFVGATAMVSNFVEEMLRPQKEAVRNSAHFLRQQIERLRSEAFGLETELTEFKSENARELPELHSLNLQAHLELRKLLTEAEVRLAAKERQREVFGERLRRGSPVLRRLEQQLVEASAGLVEARLRYTSADPRFKVASERVRALQEALDAEKREATPLDLRALDAHVGPLSTERSAAGVSADGEPKPGTQELFASEILAYKGLQVEIESARGETELLRRRVEESQSALSAHANHEQSLNRMNRELDIKLQLYRSLLSKYEDALVTEELSQFDETHQVWIVESPVRPATSMKPALSLAVIAGAVCGLLFSLLAALLLEAVDGRIRTPRELEMQLGVPVLGRLRYRVGSS